MQTLAELKPKLNSHLVHSEGDRLIVEGENKQHQAILEKDKRVILALLDGNHSFRDIISLLYISQGSLSFRSTFGVLTRLREAGLLDTRSNQVLLQMDSLKTPYNQPSSMLSRSFREIVLADKVQIPIRSRILFYAVSCAIIFALPFLPKGVLYQFPVTSFLRIHQSYHLAIPGLILGCSGLMVAKYFIKWILLGLATGHIYRPSVRFHWFGISLGVSDNSIYSLGKGAPVLIYTVASGVLHLVLASLFASFFPQSPWGDSIKVLAGLLTFAALDPYRQSDLTKLFTFFLNQDQMGSILPYLKNRALFSALDRKTSVKGELRYVIYSTLALIWGMSLLVFSIDLIAANFPNFILTLREGDILDKISDVTKAGILSWVLLYLCYDLLETLFKNILYPILTPVRSLLLRSQANENKTFDTQKLRDVLKQSWFGGDLSEASMDHFLKYGQMMRFKKGARLIVQDTLGQELFILLRGKVDVIHREETGLTRKVATLRPNTIFGEVSIIENSPRTADVVATEETEAYVIGKPALDKLLEHPALKEDYRKVLQQISLAKYLSSSQVFKDLPKETLSILREHSELEKHESGTVITTEGEMDKSFYLVLRGTAEVVKNGKKVGELKEGDFFGEVAFLANIARTATVKTMVKSLLLKVNSEVFWDILSENINFAMYIEGVAERRQGG